MNTSQHEDASRFHVNPEAGREALGRAEAMAGFGGKEHHDPQGLGTEEHLCSELLGSGLALLLAPKTSQSCCNGIQNGLDPPRPGRTSNVNCQGPELPVLQVGSGSKLGACRGSGKIFF